MLSQAALPGTNPPPPTVAMLQPGSLRAELPAWGWPWPHPAPGTSLQELSPGCAPRSRCLELQTRHFAALLPKPVLTKPEFTARTGRGSRCLLVRIPPAHVSPRPGLILPARRGRCRGRRLPGRLAPSEAAPAGYCCGCSTPARARDRGWGSWAGARPSMGVPRPWPRSWEQAPAAASLLPAQHRGCARTDLSSAGGSH